MTWSRADMDDALRRVPVRALREAGFKGSYPNLVRDEGGFISLVQFQFRRSGGAFAVNLGFVGPNGENLFGPKTSRRPSMASTRVRRRLGATYDDPDHGDHWFVFQEAYPGDPFGPARQPEVLAEEVRVLIDTDAADWWNVKRHAF